MEKFGPAPADGAWLEQTRQSLLVLRTRLRASGPAVVILPPHAVLTKFIKVPPVTAAKREQVVRFEAAQGIPFPLHDVVWDSMESGGPDVLLAAAKLESVRRLCAAVQAAGFAPRLVVPSPLATLAAFRQVHPVLRQCELVLNLGARSTTLLLIEPDRFAIRTLALGGDGLSVPDAGGQGGGAELFATHLVREISRTTLYFGRQSNFAGPTRIHLTGGCAGIAGLAEALIVKLKLPVAWLDVSNAVTMGCDVQRSDIVAQSLVLTDLIGGAAIGGQCARRFLNLLPPERLGREKLRRRLPWLAMAAALAMAALVLPIAHFRSLTTEAQRKTAAIERAIAPLRVREARLRSQLRQLDDLRLELLQLHGARAQRSSWLNLLADLQGRLVQIEDVWLDRLQFIPAAAGGPAKLSVSGRMLDRAGPGDTRAPDARQRVQALFSRLVDSPFVAAIEAERFDVGQPGILKFDFVLVVDAQHPL